MSPDSATDLDALHRIASAIHNAGTVDELWLAAEQVVGEYLSGMGFTVLCQSDDGELTVMWSTVVDVSETAPALDPDETLPRL